MASIRAWVQNRWQQADLVGKRTSIGRASDNDVVLSDPRVSDYHAQIMLEGDSYFIQPLGSGGDIRVNGRRVKREKLSHDAQISLNGIEILFSLHEAPNVEDNQQELKAYQRLNAFSARLAKEFSIDAMLEALLDAVIETTNADKGFVVLFDGTQPVLKSARNFSRTSLPLGEGQISDSILAKVIATKKPIIVSDALHDQEFHAAESVISLRLASVMCVPLLVRGELFGALYLGNDNIVSLFDESSLALLTIFAAQAALLIQNALLVNELRIESQELSSRLARLQQGEIVASCENMLSLVKTVRKVATVDVSVLLLGETGTGKELIARELHRLSNRAKGPFVAVNCGAIPESLLESELFGHVKGAFTGANSSRVGMFQAANGGTLFLDEIGEMPMQLQVKLLRALAERAVVRVGESRPEPVDIRVIAATHRNLHDEIKAGRFREDLYFRLHVVSLELPPLRDRGDDILLLAGYFLQRYAREYNARVRSFAPEASMALLRYTWPGNIRELENRIKRAIVLAERATLGPEELGFASESQPAIATLAEAREQWQRSYIQQALLRNNGNRTKAAAELGVDVRTLFRHLSDEKEGQ